MPSERGTAASLGPVIAMLTDSFDRPFSTRRSICLSRLLGVCEVVEHVVYAVAHKGDLAKILYSLDLRLHAGKRRGNGGSESEGEGGERCAHLLSSP